MKTVNGDICAKKQVSVKAVVETCHGRFYLQHGARPVLLLERSDCAANSRRASDDLCFWNSLALFNARRQTHLCDTARTAGICCARLYPISSTISIAPPSQFQAIIARFDGGIHKRCVCRAHLECLHVS